MNIVRLTKLNRQSLELITVIACALIAFAANSILCRLALKDELIDPAGFTIVRMVSAAAIFSLLLSFTNKRAVKAVNSQIKNPKEVKLKHTKISNFVAYSSMVRWTSALSLFIYAITFSYAYTLLDAASGALILFGTVQLTIIMASLRYRERLKHSEWVGIMLSFGGLAYLMLPSANSPNTVGFSLMVLSGVAWGLYTLSGKQSNAPFLDTAQNFILTLPFVILIGIITFTTIEFTSLGVIYALLSGMLASALGYTLWFKALPNLTATEAGALQLSVPIITALAGVLFLSEALTFSLVISSMLVLGGITLVILAKK